MLRLGRKIRLTGNEIERFILITDIVPDGVRTEEDLRAYVRECKQHYWGSSAQTAYLHWLLDRELTHCLEMARPSY
jgi:hypothetical protein